MAQKGGLALIRQWGKDFQLWFYITVTLQLFRLLLISIFHEQIGPHSGAKSFLMVMGNGLRFDISTAGVWVLPTFLLSLALLVFPIDAAITKLRGFVASIFAVLSVLVFGVDLLFFNTYGDQFNQLIFGIVHDDTLAILITVWKEYHPLLFLTIVTPLILANLWLIRRWLGYKTGWLEGVHQLLPHRVSTLAIGSLLFLLMATVVRGGTLWGEPIRLKHAFVVDDLFLNRTVVDPFSALRYTLKTKLQLEKGAALKQFWPSQKIDEALRYELHQREVSLPSSTDLDQALTVSSHMSGKEKPKHIFLILMESHSGWTVMPRYRFAGLSPALSELADKGIYFPNFLPSSAGTIGSLNALVTGLPDTGLNINYEPTSATAYASSLAANMKRLGYTTRFFYGGFLSWQRLDAFAGNQGFDELYGGGSMSANTHTNEWGVDDRYLFDYVLETVKEDTPSFNFILTTSNHPPYDLDLDALGYHLKDKLPSPLVATKEKSVNVLGHLWYSDQQAGRFVRKAEQKFERPVFAITGDHTARLSITFPGDNVIEQTAVPFILYGPDVLPESGVTKATAGSHLDIPPTLIELAADPGYRYTAYGQNMLEKTSPSYGFGWRFIVGEDFVATDDEQSIVYSLPDTEPPAQPPQLTDKRKRFNALKALGWYRVKKGPDLTPETRQASVD